LSAETSTRDRAESTLEIEFGRAMQEYKQASGRMFPTWSEVLEVLQKLGYRKLEQENSSALAEADAAALGTLLERTG
jgi:hypothetical protein